MNEYNVVCIPAEPFAVVTSPSTIPMEVYERMCRTLYAYRFGTIGFLDLLVRWEEALGITPPQANE